MHAWALSLGEMVGFSDARKGVEDTDYVGVSPS